MGEKKNALENSYLKLCTEKTGKNLHQGIYALEFALRNLYFKISTLLHHLILKSNYFDNCRPTFVFLQNVSFLCTTQSLFNDFGQDTDNENKICSYTIFDPQNSMVILPKSQDEAVTSSFWPHLICFIIPPDGNVKGQNPFNLHINMHQG